MRVKDFMTLLVDCFGSHPLVQSVIPDDAAYVWNNADIPYPSVALSLTSVTESETETTFSVNIYAGERQREDIDSSTLDNYDELHGILEEVLDMITENPDIPAVADTPRAYTFAKLKMMDMLAVVSLTATFTVLADENCK